MQRMIWGLLVLALAGSVHDEGVQAGGKHRRWFASNCSMPAGCMGCSGPVLNCSGPWTCAGSCAASCSGGCAWSGCGTPFVYPSPGCFAPNCSGFTGCAVGCSAPMMMTCGDCGSCAGAFPFAAPAAVNYGQEGVVTPDYWNAGPMPGTMDAGQLTSMVPSYYAPVPAQLPPIPGMPAAEDIAW